jgi:hypothetical protein
LPPEPRVTQGVDASGNVVHTVTSSNGSLTTQQKEAAEKLLGPKTRTPSEPRGKQPGNGHDSEERGGRASEGQKDRVQASKSAATRWQTVSRVRGGPSAPWDP